LTDGYEFQMEVFHGKQLYALCVGVRALILAGAGSVAPHLAPDGVVSDPERPQSRLNWITGASPESSRSPD
jgi:hypothetical protein